jgi:hypothetical protein
LTSFDANEQLAVRRWVIQHGVPDVQHGDSIRVVLTWLWRPGHHARRVSAPDEMTKNRLK